MGWVVLSGNTIDTPGSQEIGITIDAANLLAGQDYSETIEIETNGGNETVYVDISTEAVSNTDVIISLIRSVVSRHRLKASIIFCGTIFCLWILGNGLVSYHKSLTPALSQVDQGEKPAAVSESVRIYPSAPVLAPPAPPRRFIFEFQPVIVVLSGYGFPAMPGRRFYGGRVCRMGGRRH